MTLEDILKQTMRDCETLARDPKTSNGIELLLLDMVWAYKQPLDSQSMNRKEVCGAIEDLYSEAINRMKFNKTFGDRNPSVVESLEKAKQFVLEKNKCFHYREPNGKITTFIGW